MSTHILGVEVGKIPDCIDNKEDFIRCLFLSQGLTSYDSKYIIEAIHMLCDENVIKLYEILKSEIEKEAFLRKTLISEINEQKDITEYYNKSKTNVDIINKLNTWAHCFTKPSNIETSDYYNFFSIKSVELEDLKVKHNSIHLKKPSDIYAELKKFIIGQDEAVKNISFAFYLHLLKTGKITPEIYNLTNTSRMQGDLILPDPHLMLIGPTGAGKTHIIKTLCSLFDVPFVKVDCSQLIVSGYVGLQVENALTMIYLKAKNKSEAEQGVIYFDEFDKIKESSKSKSLGGSNLQYEFLSLFDDDEKMINVDMSKYADRMSFKTTKLMFIFSGSFFGIESNIKKRINQHTIGYSNNLLSQNLSASELQKELTPQDFIEFGIIPELIGRISYYVALDNLTRAQIVEIIKNTENSFLSGFENYFWLHYNKLIIDEDVYGLIADKVIENNLGARTIKSILQKLLAESLFKSANPVMNTYHITKEYYYKIIGK